MSDVPKTAIELMRRGPVISVVVIDRAASDLSGAAVLLASPASDYVSGITLPVDGGWLGR